MFILKLMSRIIVLCLFCLSPIGSSASAQPIVPVSDANWFFSPYNWHAQGSKFAETTRTGAYFKIGFTGTSIGLGVDVTPLKSMPASLLPLIRWQIDSLPMQDYQLHRNDTTIPLNSSPLPSGAHSLSVWLVASDPFTDRWTQPLVNVLRITGLSLDPGAMTLPPVLRPTRMVFFGDSITEGVSADKGSGNALNNNDALHAYTYACAAGLNAEFGVVGQGGMGWTFGGVDGVTPPLPASWQWQFQALPRLFSPEPDYLIVMAGGNDFVHGPVDPNIITSVITTWLTQVRSVMPDTKVFVLVEFNGFYRDADTRAVTAYQQANPWDKSVYLIDLGATGQEGLLTYASNQGSLYSYDGIHPIAARQEVLGQMVAQAIQAALSK